MLNILNKPYPRNSSIRYKIPIVFLSGFFVSVVLLFIISFQGGFVFSSELFINVFLFGLVTVLCMSLTELVLPFLWKNFFLEENWTVGKNLCMWLLTLVVISAGNMLLANYLYRSSISWQAFVQFLYYTLGIGFFVYSIFNVINYKRLVKRNEADAVIMNAEISNDVVSKTTPGDEAEGPNTSSGQPGNSVTITSENGREEVNFFMDDLLYIESADNYSKIICMYGNKLQTSIIRSSLKRVEEQVKHPQLFRCHRGYIVNIKKVISVSGNSQGYRLHLNAVNETIPVSRNSGKEFLEMLKRLS